MRELINVFIDCIPPKATKQQRKVGKSFGTGKAISYKDPKVKQAEELICALFLKHKTTHPMLDQPMEVSIDFVWPFTKGTPQYKRDLGRIPKTTKPDLDNVVKLFLDAVAPIFFVNDAQVYRFRDLGKYYGTRPGIGLVIWVE